MTKHEEYELKMFTEMLNQLFKKVNNQHVQDFLTYKFNINE